MRNYLKIFGCQVQARFASSGSNTDQVCWADTEDVLEFRINEIKTGIEAGAGPPQTYKLIRAIVYFELNKENFAVLLNGGGSMLTTNYSVTPAEYVWDQIKRLPPVEFGYYGPFSPAQFDGFTVVEEPSPRKSWSRGH